MLGKLIKNEFVQRTKPILLILCGELGFSFIIALLDVIITGKSPEALRILLRLTTVLYGFVMVAGIIAVIIYIINDFRNRLFKDQGYLTHTLPVKPSAIMLARILCDTVFMAISILGFELSASIAAWDFSTFSSFLDMIRDLCEYSSLNFSNASFMLLTVLIIIGILLTCLVSIWHFNAAYAIGHAFTGGRRLISVVAYLVISFIQYVIIYIFSYLSSTDAISSALQPLFTDDLSIVTFMFILIDVYDLIALVIFAIITARVCKKHLNLE
jgi:hypothetical protein